jgi:hypothetical protein
MAASRACRICLVRLQFDRTKRHSGGASMRIRLAFAAGAVVVCSMPAFAYTASDAKACMGDAFRLCAKAIPNQSRVAACLQAKQSQLSAGCAEALDRFTRAMQGGHGHERMSAD